MFIGYFIFLECGDEGNLLSGRLYPSEDEEVAMNSKMNQPDSGRWPADLKSIWNIQNRVFDVYRDYVVQWVERRQESAKSALDTTRELMNCDDGSSALDIYNKFLAANFERWVDDLGEYAKCQGQATHLLQNRIQSAAEDATAQFREAASSFPSEERTKFKDK